MRVEKVGNLEEEQQPDDGQSLLDYSLELQSELTMEDHSLKAELEPYAMQRDFFSFVSVRTSAPGAERTVVCAEFDVFADLMLLQDPEETDGVINITLNQVACAACNKFIQLGLVESREDVDILVCWSRPEGSDPNDASVPSRLRTIFSVGE